MKRRGYEKRKARVLKALPRQWREHFVLLLMEREEKERVRRERIQRDVAPVWAEHAAAALRGLAEAAPAVYLAMVMAVTKMDLAE